MNRSLSRKRRSGKCSEISFPSVSRTWSTPPRFIRAQGNCLLTIRLRSGPNAGRILSRYDPVLVADKLNTLCTHHSNVFSIHRYTGERVLDQPKFPLDPERPTYNGHRADFHRVIYEYAKSLGISIHLGQRVVSYHEDDREWKAWVATEQGLTFRGDVVVGADGVCSQARKLVLGYNDNPKSSGYAVCRAWFNAKDAGIADDPLTREFVANGDTHTGCQFPPPELFRPSL